MPSKIDAFVLAEPTGVFVLFMIDVSVVIAVVAAVLPLFN